MANPKDLYFANFSWLLRAEKIKLQPWDKTKFTWLGQISILKMMILPKIFYFYRIQMLPVRIAKSYFRLVCCAFSDFVWYRIYSFVTQNTPEA